MCEFRGFYPSSPVRVGISCWRMFPVIPEFGSTPHLPHLTSALASHDHLHLTSSSGWLPQLDQV
ncbi:hypothetical protein E2C01_043528 [Portunus trituberculatus]|uniref:Uncharacterized protein n=1 Tax=Portunus trituberculatus TaxID=210409 RepID=A0A5B7FVZ3_PORTR|nr:hypothetical protein [Portunus trituberculatus]